MKRTALRFGAIAMATAAVGLGVAAASSATIDTTGPMSHNKVSDTMTNTVEIDNHNKVHVDNNNDQSATSGDAKVSYNTTGGDATSGDAKNDNSTDTSITVGSSCGCTDLGSLFGNGGGNDSSISNTGPKSHNDIKITTTNTLSVENQNYVHVDNNNDQSATTGDAKVYYNTTGGDATSGSASNTNSTSTSISL